ncbi:MAG: outer membrane beta-barrel protein [Gammaproteobacteria bacterium]
MKRVAASAVALLLCSPAVAVEKGAYVGLSVISTEVDIAADDFNDGSFVAAADDNTATGFKLRGGYNFNPYVGVELDWIDGSEVSFDAVSDGTVIYPPGPLAIDLELSGISAGLNGYLPFGETVHGIGRVGFFRWNTDISVDTAFFSASDSADDTDMFFGLGVGVEAGPLVIEVGWSRYALDDVDADTLDVGLLYTPGK